MVKDLRRCVVRVYVSSSYHGCRTRPVVGIRVSPELELERFRVLCELI
jgi:hypothetical protein